MSEQSAAHEHAIVWSTEPYLVWGGTAIYAGACRLCGRTFQREAPRAANPTCPHCSGTGYVETREAQSHVTSYVRCACARDDQ